jgi:hypothetical protein
MNALASTYPEGFDDKKTIRLWRRGMRNNLHSSLVVTRFLLGIYKVHKILLLVY